MELQIQHIIGYLPWGLEVQISEECLVKGKIPSVRRRMVGIVDEEIYVHQTGYRAKTEHDIEDCAPLLKPMTKEVLEEVFEGVTNIGWDMELYPKWIIDEFHKRHVDYQDLIGKGLAIDILTLKTK